LQALPTDIILTTNNLPSGYHRDFQILKEILFRPMTQFANILDILLFAVPALEVTPGVIDQPKYDAIFSVENINQLIQNGVPFRDAYKQVGQAVDAGTYEPHKEFLTSHLGSVHRPGLAELGARLAQVRARLPWASGAQVG
jgi:argininosuccinate lyase